MSLQDPAAETSVAWTHWPLIFLAWAGVLGLVLLGIPLPGVSAWSGVIEKRWTILPDGPPPKTAIHIEGLDDVAVISRRDAWAVGYYTDESTGGNYPAAEHWNGEYWAYVSTPVDWLGDGVFYGMTAFSTRDVWAVGTHTPGDDRPLAEHWDGSAWTHVPAENPSARAYLFAVGGVSSEDLWAVGQDFAAPQHARTLIEHWNGRVWRIVPSPSFRLSSNHNELVSLAAVSSDDVWAVGDARNVTTNVQHTLVEHWDGTAWSIIPAPSPREWANLASVTARSASDVWAVGSQAPHFPQPRYSLVEHWDGTRWREVAARSPGGTLNELYDVVAVGADQVWAVGAYADDHVHTLTELWDGRSWAVIPSPNPKTTSGGGSSLGSVDVIPQGGGLWAVGGFYNEQAPSNALIEHYGVPFCSDGVDNDDDGAADYPDDPGCKSAGEGSEIGATQCDDGLDNDGDGKIDYRVDGTGDPECSLPADDDELLPLPPLPLPAQP